MNRVHIIGLPHLPISEKYQTCAYTQKIVKLIKQCKLLDYEVYVYGIGISEYLKQLCDNYIQLLNDELVNNISPYISNLNTSDFYKWDDAEFNNTYAISAGIYILNNLSSNKDIVCNPFGNVLKPTTDLIKDRAICIESGIGYSGTYLDNKVWESYTWMHTIGYSESILGNQNWVVIPNCIDINDSWIRSEKKDDYFIYCARLIHNKGLPWAIEISKALGKKLVVMGQGDINPFITDDNIKYIEYLGVINDLKTKSEFISKAIGMFCLTQYIEPFGTVQIESFVSGTPVISTDWGVFPEVNIHGVTGYRTRNLKQAIEFTKQIDKINPEDCVNHAISKYTIEVTAKQYDDYFQSLSPVA